MGYRYFTKEDSHFLSRVNSLRRYIDLHSFKGNPQVNFLAELANLDDISVSIVIKGILKFLSRVSSLRRYIDLHSYKGNPQVHFLNRVS